MLSARGKLTNGARISIVIADDQPITLAGLDAVLAREPDFLVVARCADGYETLRATAVYRPDILIVGQDLPGSEATPIVNQLRRSGEETRVVVLVRTDSQRLREVLELGVEGVILRNAKPQLLVRCVRDVCGGRRWLDPRLDGRAAEQSGRVPALDTLTRRQIEVARAAVSGLSNKELAQRLGVSEGTIKNHLHAIYERLNVDGRLALLLYLRDKAVS
jgi:two-component system nitrate/nitrite response regulator NarP